MSNNQWLDENYERAIDYVANNQELFAEVLYEDDEEFKEAFLDSTVNHQTLEVLEHMGWESFEELLTLDEE